MVEVDGREGEEDDNEKIEIVNHCWDVRRQVINPYSDFIGMWDKIIMLVLFWTALVTPFEVSFMTPDFNHMFILNRCIDFVFLVDICMTFFMDPMDKMELKTDGFPDHSKMAVNYLKGHKRTTIRGGACVLTLCD